MFSVCFLPVCPQIVVTAKDWPQREAFLQVLRNKLGAEQQRKPWYPGSDAKHAAFHKRFPKVSSVCLRF